MLSLKPTVYVVDPDASVRSSLEYLIRRAGWTPAIFASASAFLRAPRTLGPSCLLLELVLPDLDGFELQRLVSTERRETPIIVMSGSGDIPMTVRAMKAGAVEFVLKPLSESVLADSVGEALARSSAVLQQVRDLEELERRHDSLSEREREVMARVVAGFLNKQVGAALGISIITVKAHRGRVMRKMGADSLAELVNMAMRLRPRAVPGWERAHRVA